MVDRRNNKRISLSLWMEEENKEMVHFHRMANLSEGGFFIEKTIPHGIGTQVIIRFSLPSPNGEKEIEAKGEVVAIHQSPPGMHLKFINMEDSDKKTVKNFIEDSSD